ncbi:hypothetical protein D3C81_1895330 [compost metagenome]
MMPGERVTASCTVRLLRCWICSMLMLLVLAGVSRALRPRREPAWVGVARAMARLSRVSVMAVAGRARGCRSRLSARAGRETARQAARG